MLTERSVSDGGKAECVILVDNSNLFIEGQKVSAWQKGQRGTGGPGDRQPADISWRMDFANLLTELSDGRKIREAILVGSRPPPNDAVWTMAKQSGFTVITHDRDAANREKAVDTELVAQGTLLIATVCLFRGGAGATFVGQAAQQG